jgi:uncharacterized protein YecT (DUF1311 family)
MTTFRSRLVFAALLLAGCDQTGGEEQGNVVKEVGTSVTELPTTMASANMLVGAQESAPTRPLRHALAGTNEPTADYRRCMGTGEAGKGITSGMRQCLAAEFRRQDERLNSSYQAALAQLARDEQSTLRSLQRTWLAERDADCEQRAEPNKRGTLYPIVFGRCILDATIEQATWLENHSPGKK